MIEIRKKTGLKKMPQSCLKCKYGLAECGYGERYCELLCCYVGSRDYMGYQIVYDYMSEETHRHKNCPLVEVNN